jgi:hypothetical protein
MTNPEETETAIAEPVAPEDDHTDAQPLPDGNEADDGSEPLPDDAMGEVRDDN